MLNFAWIQYMFHLIVTINTLHKKYIKKNKHQLKELHSTFSHTVQVFTSTHFHLTYCRFLRTLYHFLICCVDGRVMILQHTPCRHHYTERGSELHGIHHCAPRNAIISLLKAVHRVYITNLRETYQITYKSKYLHQQRILCLR